MSRAKAFGIAHQRADAADLNFLAGAGLPGTKPVGRVHICGGDAEDIPQHVQKAAGRQPTTAPQPTPPKETDMPKRIDNQKPVLALLKQGQQTHAQIKAATRLNDNQTHQAIYQLKKKGLIEKTLDADGQHVFRLVGGESPAGAPGKKDKAKKPAKTKAQPKAATASKRPVKPPLPAPAPVRNGVPHPALATADGFEAAITGSGALLIYEAANAKDVLYATPIVIAPPHARALVDFLRTLPSDHELALQ